VRLLVIEDEPRIAEILKSGLQRAGFAVDVVQLCADAREALALTVYDAAILDLGLPDGDGLDLLAELRSAHNGVNVLVLTARDAVENRVSGLDAGADDYLVKPFATVELIAGGRAGSCRRPSWKKSSTGSMRNWNRTRFPSMCTIYDASCRTRRQLPKFIR